MIGWRSDDNLTQAKIDNEEIVISIGNNEWKTTKEHWNKAIKEKKPIQHSNINIKTSTRTISCTTDDSTRVAKQLTDSYSEWFAPHGEEWWQWNKDFKEGKTKAPLIYARSTAEMTPTRRNYTRKVKEGEHTTSPKWKARRKRQHTHVHRRIQRSTATPKSQGSTGTI